jgi:hypothetical protein
MVELLVAVGQLAGKRKDVGAQVAQRRVVGRILVGIFRLIRRVSPVCVVSADDAVGSWNASGQVLL